HVVHATAMTSIAMTVVVAVSANSAGAAATRRVTGREIGRRQAGDVLERDRGAVRQRDRGGPVAGGLMGQRVLDFVGPKSEQFDLHLRGREQLSHEFVTSAL